MERQHNFFWQPLLVLPNDKNVFFTYSLSFSFFHLCHLSLTLTGTGCSQKLESLCPWRYSKPNGPRPRQPAPVDPVWAGGLGQMVWRSPFQPQWFCDFVTISWHSELCSLLLLFLNFAICSFTPCKYYL